MLTVWIPLNLSVLRNICKFEFASRAFLLAAIGTAGIVCLVLLFPRLQVFHTQMAQIVFATNTLQHVSEVSQTNGTVILVLVTLFSFFGLLIYKLDFYFSNMRLQLQICLFLRFRRFPFFFFKTGRTFRITRSSPLPAIPVVVVTSDSRLVPYAIWPPSRCTGTCLRWTA